MAPKKFEVIISGISGVFPECESLDELEMKLMNKENVITVDERRWRPGDMNVPAATGKLKNPTSLDRTFFGIFKKLFDVTDPLTILSLKHSYEAIFDAGVNPLDLSGTNTAVIMSSVVSETEYKSIKSYKFIGYGLLGQSKSMQANRISFFLNVKGPSLVMDASWSGGMQALQEAYTLISSGITDSALVGACNLILRPEISVQYQLLGSLSDDGYTKSFSANADGYTRSEGCVVLFLQRAEHAKRSYGSLLNVLSKQYGSRDAQYADFSGECYKAVLEECYKKRKIDPSEVCYVEADGCASTITDAMELNSISEVMCKNRKTPLPIGCIKSNIGHTEAASSLVSIAKAVIALRSGVIPPNLHYDSPNPNVPALLNGVLQVVTEPTPLTGNIVGVSSIGMCGTYCHAIIKQNPKVKPIKERVSPITIPWLLPLSGRVEEGLNAVFEKVERVPFDEEFIALSHSVFKTNIKQHLFRGYTLLNINQEHNHEVKPYDGAEKRPIWFLFSGMGSQWTRMGVDLLRIPTFARSIRLSHDVLLTKGINLLEILHSEDPNVYASSILHSFVGIAAIQIGLVDVLKELGVEPDGLIGHSVGELGCAYADGCFTAEQMILSAYARGRASVEATLIKGMMAAVGLGYNQIKDQLPPEIEVACHNSEFSCTLSGPVEDMEKYIDTLKQKGTFAKLVNVANIAYHSKFIKPAAPALLKYLKQVIPEPEPKPRSKRWVSSSIPEALWDSELAKYSSAEYHTNNLLSSVLFEEASAHIPAKAIVIEIAPHGLLQSIVKISLSKCINIPLINRFEKDTLKHLFQAIGKMYLEGIDMNLGNLYPKVDYPVSRNVPSLGQLLTWENVTSPLTNYYKKSLGKFSVHPSWSFIKISDKSFQKFLGFKINNKLIIPPTMFLFLVMEIYKNTNKDGHRSFVMESVNFKTEQVNDTSVHSDIYTLLQKGVGEFEVNLESVTLASGQIKQIRFGELINFKPKERFVEEPSTEINHKDIYKYFKEFSVEFEDSFKLIQKVSFNDAELHATVYWQEEWVQFLQAILMLLSFYETVISNKLKIVQAVRQLAIDPLCFEGHSFKEVHVFYDRQVGELTCEGLYIHLPVAQICNIPPTILTLIEETFQLLPYNTSNANCGTFENCLQIIMQNGIKYEGKANKLIVITSEDNNDLSNCAYRILSKNIQVEFIVSPSEDILNLVYLELGKNNNLLMLGRISSCEINFECLKKVNLGFIVLKDNDEVLGNPTQFFPLYKFKFNEQLFTLYKANYLIKRSDIIHTSNKQWKNLLKTFLSKEVSKTSSLEIVHVVGRTKSLSAVYNLMKYCLSLENSDLIRFVFLDDEAPKFALDQPFYKKQLEMDLVVNINIDRKWGCLKLLNKPVTSTDQFQPTIRIANTLYPLSAIKSEKISLIALGLNICEDSGSDQGQKIGPLDYCGVDKSGSTVFGIGRMSDKKTLIEDEYLCWKKPENWSYEDAASVPLWYSVAYCMWHKRKIPVKSIILLAHQGCLLLSQAIINIALAEGCEVFTTYKTVEEKKQINQLFPMINEDHILLNKSGHFDTSINILTKGRGVNLIVNASEEISTCKASLRCIGNRGILFQLNVEQMKNRSTIGMSVFTKQIGMYGFHVDSLLDIPPSGKKIIQKQLSVGMKKGHVKPFQTIRIPVETFNDELIDMLRNESLQSVKLVSTMDSNCLNVSKNVFTCIPERSYIIYSQNGIFWLDLLNWLIARGAQHIHFLMEEQSLVTTTQHRLNSTLNNHPSVSVKLNSNHIDRSFVKKWLEELNYTEQIEDVYLVGKDLDNNASLLDSVLREIKCKCNFVCIGNGGETPCELRDANQLPTLAIYGDVLQFNSATILFELDRFRNKILETPVVFLKEDISIARAGNKDYLNLQQRLPNDVEELLKLFKKDTEKACFVEVTSSCSTQKYNREESPVFVISSLKPKEMEVLTSRLFHPTFEARLPSNIDDIDAVAKELCEDLRKFNLNIFTLITNDWGGALGISLAKYLEENGKLVYLIMLDSAPDFVQRWVSFVLQQEDTYLINKYIKLPYQIKKKLPSLNTWEEKLEFALLNAEIDDSLKENIASALKLLKTCLISLINYRPSGKKYQGKYFVFCHNDESDQSFSNDIIQYCKSTPDIYISGDSNHQGMLNNEDIAKKINTLIPHDYKTAARINCLQQIF